MSFTNRWAIREVAIASFFDLVTGNLKARLDSLKMSGLENTAVTVYANGSQGNPKLVGFSGDRAAKFTLQDALFTNDVIGMMLGNDVVVGAQTVIQSELLNVTSGSATLSHSPTASGSLLSVNAVNLDGTIGAPLSYISATPLATNYTVTTKTVGLNVTAFPTGTQIQVYYNTAAGVDTRKLTAKTDKFAGSYKLVLDVLVRDAYLKQDFAAQIVVPNAKIEDSWKLDMKPDGDPSVLDIPMEALKPSGSKDLYSMTIYDEDELV